MITPDKRRKKVLHLRLLNQDEIICQLEEENPFEMTISKPMIVEEKHDQHGNQSIILSRYLMDAGNKPIILQKAHVVTRTEVIKEIETYYYNSMEFSAMFMEKQIVDAIQQTNRMMETQLFNIKKLDEIKMDEGKMKKKIFFHSNTLH